MLVILIFNFAQVDIKCANPSPPASCGQPSPSLALSAEPLHGVEKDRGCLDGLLLAPVDRSAIFFGKAISNLAFMLIVEAIVLPLYPLLYNEVRIFQPAFLGVILLGSIGYIAVGTLLSAMSCKPARGMCSRSAFPCGSSRFAGIRQSQWRITKWRNLRRDPHPAQPAHRLRRDLHRCGLHGF